MTLHITLSLKKHCSPGDVGRSQQALVLNKTLLAPMKMARRRKKSRWALPRDRCWKHWKCRSSTWHFSFSAGLPTPSLAHGEAHMSDRKSNIHFRDTIDSVFGYSYSKKVLQHQIHYQYAKSCPADCMLSLKFGIHNKDIVGCGYTSKSYAS